jgi:pimeloyl-ACP methyl ester carboxylesterase
VVAASLGMVAGLVLERAAMRRERRRPDPAVADDFKLPDDVRHGTVPVSDGGRLHVVERGPATGRPLVLLHGVALSAALWHYQLTDLANRFRVLAVEHRGHGLSLAGDAGFSIGRLAQDLAELLEALDLGDAVLVGHSMGGMTVLQFAVDHPGVLGERVAGSVLASSLASTEGRIPWWHTVSVAAAPATGRAIRLAGRLPGGYLPSTDLSYLIARMGLGARPSPTHVELTRAMTAATSAAVLADLWVETERFDVRRQLRSVDMPTLVVAGTRDNITPLANAEEIVRNLRGSSLVKLRGSGHLPMLERREEFNSLVVDFAEGLA